MTCIVKDILIDVDLFFLPSCSKASILNISFMMPKIMLATLTFLDIRDEIVQEIELAPLDGSRDSKEKFSGMCPTPDICTI